MSDYSGAFGAVEVGATLWLVPLIPALGALGLALGARVRPPGAPSPAGGPVAAWIAPGAALGSLLVALAHTAQVLIAPGVTVVAPGWPMVRFGSCDLGLLASLDARTAPLLLAVQALLCVSAFRSRRSSPGVCGALLLALAAASLAVLADGVPAAIAGMSLLGLALSALGARDAGAARRVLAVGAAADALLLLGALLLAWGLGGSFGPGGELQPELRPRLVAVDQATQAPADDDDRPSGARLGGLTVLALPGSRVIVGGAELCELAADGTRGGLAGPNRPCRVAARTPFVGLALPVAMHDVRLVPRGATDDFVAEHVRVTNGRDTSVALLGPSFSLREIDAEIGLRDKSGSYPLRVALAARRLAGQSLLELLVALLGLGVLLRAAALPGSSAAPPETAETVTAQLAWAVLVVAPLALLARLGVVVSYAPRASGLLALLGASLAVFFALRAARAADPVTVGCLLLRSAVASAVVAIVVGAQVAALVGLAVQLLAVAAFLLLASRLAPGATPLSELAGAALARPGLRRAQLAASLAFVGAPLPGLGAGFAREAATHAAFAGEQIALVPGALPGVALMIVGGVASFAAFRVHLVLATGSAGKAKPSSPREGALELALGAIALGLGAVLASSGPLGLGGSSLAERWAAPLLTAADLAAPSSSLRALLAAIGFGAGVLGFWLASRRYGARRAEQWADAEVRAPLAAWFASPAHGPSPVDGLARAGALVVALDERLFPSPPDQAPEPDAGADP